MEREKHRDRRGETEMGRIAGRQTAEGVYNERRKHKIYWRLWYSDPQLAKSKQQMKKQREVEQMKG